MQWLIISQIGLIGKNKVQLINQDNFHGCGLSQFTNECLSLNINISLFLNGNIFFLPNQIIVVHTEAVHLIYSSFISDHPVSSVEDQNLGMIPAAAYL